MKKITIILMVLLLVGCNVKAQFDGNLKTLALGDVTQYTEIDVNKTTYDDLIKAYGLADVYSYNERIFDPSDLPNLFYMSYGQEMSFKIRNKQILEMRIESDKAIYKEDLYVGQPMGDALKVLSDPEEIVSDIDLYYKENVLYKNVQNKGDGDLGYYYDTENNIRIWFAGDLVSALYYVSDFNTKTITKSRAYGGYLRTLDYNYFYSHIESHVQDFELIGNWKYLDFVHNIDDFEYGKRRTYSEFIDLNVLMNGSVEKSHLVWTKGKFVSLNLPLREIFKYEIKNVKEKELLILTPYIENEGIGIYIFEREDK